MKSRNPHLPQISAFYHVYLEDRDLSGFQKRAASTYTPGTLERLVAHHETTVRQAAVLALTAQGDFRASRALARALHDPDSITAMLAETGMKMLWRRDGSPEDRQALEEIIAQINAGNFGPAMILASAQLARTPDFAEVWHQRGCAWFALGEYDRAADDFRQTLKRNPHHFTAAAMLGHAFLLQGKKSLARRAFRRGRLIHPGLKTSHRKLRQLLENR